MRLIVIFSIITSFLLQTCKSSNHVKKNGEGAIKTESSIILGWIDGNTFRVKARSIDRDSAIRKAQTAIIEKFVIERIGISHSIKDIKSTGVIVSEEFGDIIRSGSVIKEYCDDKQNYKIIYEIKSDGLKEQVTKKG